MFRKSKLQCFVQRWFKCAEGGTVPKPSLRSSSRGEKIQNCFVNIKLMPQYTVWNKHD